MKMLIAYGSKMGGTVGIAEAIGDSLTAMGCDATVAPAKSVRSVAGYDAVIVGSGLYANRWRRTAARLVKRRATELRGVPVWCFSSGPLDSSARDREIPPTKQVTALMQRIGARGHATFGGRLLPDSKGFPASSMAKTRSGDWRDFDQIHAWADSIGIALGLAPPH